MSFQITGTIYSVKEVQQITDSFRKRNFSVVFLNQFDREEHVEFELLQDRVDLMEPYAEGQQVEVFFNIGGRTWTPPNGGEEKIFNKLTAWRVSPAADQPGGNISASKPVTVVPGAKPKPAEVANDQDMESHDDLPF